MSVAFLISDARYGYLEGIRKAVSVVIYPLQRLAAAPRALLDTVGEFFVTQSALRTENAKLSAQSLSEAAILRKYAALSAENAHLRGRSCTRGGHTCCTRGATFSRARSWSTKASSTA